MSRIESESAGDSPRKYTRSDIEALAFQYFERGDEDRLLDLLACHYYADVYRTCYILVQRGDVAEDLANESFANAIVGLEKFKFRSTLYTWLIRIATNCCMNYLRWKNRHDKMVVYVDPVPDSILEGTIDHSDYLLSKLVERCVSDLDEVLQRPLKERFYNELTFREIAMELRANEKTVQARVARAVELIREGVKERGGVL